MAAETQLDSMLVRLIGDGSSYQRMMTQAATSSISAAHQVQASATSIEGFGSSLRGFGQAAASALAFVGLSGTMRSMFEAFDKADDAMTVFTSLLKANGRQVEETLSQYREFADAQAAITELSTENILELLKMAESFQLTGDMAQKAARDAISLSVATGVSAETAMRVTAALASGDIARAQMMSRSILALRGVRDETEFVTRANRLMEAGLESSATMAADASGRMVQMGHALHELKKDLGSIISDAITPAVQQIKVLVDGLKNMDPAFKKILVGVLAISTAFAFWGSFQGLIRPLISSFVSLGINIVSVLNPLRAVGLLMSGLGGVKAVLFSPAMLGFGAAFLVIQAIINELGGVEKAWGIIKDAASNAWDWIESRVGEFLDWLRPAAATVKALFDVVAYGALVDVIKPLVGLLGQATTASFDWLVEFYSRNEDAIQILGLVAGAVVATIITWKALGAVIAFISFLMSALHVKQLLSFAGWLLLKVAVIGLTIAMIPFNLAWFLAGVKMAAAALTMIGTKFAVLLLSAALVVASAAYGLFTGAVTVAGVALIAFKALLAAAIFVAFVPLIVLAAAAVYGLWQGLVAVFQVLKDVSTTAGPLAAIGSVFGEWWSILKEVVKTAQTDMPAAWNLLRSGFALAVAQIRQLWGPLWTFIADGWGDLLDVMIAKSVAGARILLLEAGIASMRSIQGSGTFLNNQIANNQATINSLRQSANLVQAQASANVEVRTRNFNVVDTPETNLARTKMNMIRVENAFRDVSVGVVNAATEAGRAGGAAFTQGVKEELQRFDAVLLGSAEDIFRTAQYRMNAGLARERLPDISQQTADRAPGEESVSRQVEQALEISSTNDPQRQRTVELLTQIATNTLNVANRAPITIVQESVF